MKYCIFIILFLTSCRQEFPDKNKLVEQYYGIKKKEFLKKKDAACKKEIKEIAENQLDSIIDQYIKDRLLDSISFPKRLIKPQKPNHIIDQVKRFDVDN